MYQKLLHMDKSLEMRTLMKMNVDHLETPMAFCIFVPNVVINDRSDVSDEQFLSAVQ